MLHFLLKEHWKLYPRSWFLTYASEQGISEKTADRVCTLMGNHLPQHRIIDAERLLGILKGSSVQPDEKTAQTWLRLTGWKIQGTDGVRGIVSSAAVGALKSLRIFIEENTITQTFCNLYARAWEKMLNDLFQGSDKHSAVELSTLKIVIGEDGRDFYDKTGLKQSFIQGFSYSKNSVIDLGIVPTPALAAYSLKHDLPGVMLTASHNSARYNGIKLFMDGKKLYPDGAYGEYLLSWYIFSLAAKEDTIGKKSSRDVKTENSVFTVDKEETDKQILRLLYTSIDKKALKSLRSTPLLLDTANGAYTQTALRFFLQQEIEIIPTGCNPGKNRINADCGVGFLENLNAVLFDDETHPYIVRELFRVGRLSGKKKTFGIVLDGDGDRGFLLEYDSIEDKVYLYNGDAIGYIIASGMIINNTSNQNPDLRFVTTVESDVALSTAVRENLHVQNSITCVGDRWLLSELSPETQLLVGCERSGHVITATPLNEDSSGMADKILYTGNGLSAVLKALSYLLNTEVAENGSQLKFTPGYRLQITIRNYGMGIFYRSSELWEQVAEIVRQTISLNCRETLFIHEPDMLYFDLLESNDVSVGRWYMRKSGTEPKISFCISVMETYSTRSLVWMNTLEKKISSLIRQSI